MWDDLQVEIGERILESRHLLRGPWRRGGAESSRTTVKGLLFVQLYATYEFTVTGLVREAISDLKSRPTPINTLRLEFLSVALHPEVSAVVDCSRSRQWQARIELFRRINSADHLDIPDSVFPDDGSHFRPQQLKTIWGLFGVKSPILPDNRLQARILELVEHRNAIAHGRSTAADVGRGFSVADIKKRISDTKTICFYLANTMRLHCNDILNLTR